MYLFPYKEIKPNAKVIIYGAGKVGLDFMRQATASRYAQVLCMVDKNYRVIQKISDVSLPVIPKEDLLQFEGKYDVILIAAFNQELAFEIKEELCEFGILEEKIIWPQIAKVEDVVWDKWQLSALRDDEQRQRAMESFAREGRGKVSYFAYMIAEICMEEDKERILTEIFSLTDREECLENRIVMLRILIEAGVISGLTWMSEPSCHIL